MNYEDVTLCRLALASTMFDSLTPFNPSLGRLDEATSSGIDLTNGEHRLSLLKWLNEWGCRNLPKGQHDVASDSILDWYKVHGARLFANEKPLWDLEDGELEIAARAYGSLKNEMGAWRVRGGSKRKVRIGPTAASKVLFAIRRRALMPWDETMRVSFDCDGSPESYCKYLTKIRNFTLQVGSLCRKKGFQIDNLPQELGRPDSTVLALVNEYIWITVTRKIQLPTSETIMKWAWLG